METGGSMDMQQDETELEGSQSDQETRGVLDSGLSRRSVLMGGLAAVSIPLTHSFSLKREEEMKKVGRTIKFGYVSPETGPLAAFGAADAFVIGNLKTLLGKGVIINGVRHPIEVIVKDSQSTDATAASVADDLIKSDKIDVMLVSSTPDTTNPVADACETNRIPCISTVAPWQSWFFGRGAMPKTVYKYTYHFFWGLEDIEAVYSDIWAAGDGLPGLHQNVERLLGDAQWPVPRPHDRLHLTDFALQVEQLSDSHRRTDPPGLHHLLSAGRPAGLSAEGGDHRQGHVVPERRAGVGLAGGEREHRVLVGSHAPIQELTHARIVRRARE